MIIVVHNECHFYSNVLDYLNNFIIITISQDNYFRPPPPLIEKCFLDDVSDILLPCSCYQTTMRSGRECASRQCLPTGNKGREEREGTGSPIWRCRTFGGRQILPQHISFKVIKVLLKKRKKWQTRVTGWPMFQGQGVKGPLPTARRLVELATWSHLCIIIHGREAPCWNVLVLYGNCLKCKHCNTMRI